MTFQNLHLLKAFSKAISSKLQTPQMKTCTRCGQTKTAESFNKNARTKDGLTPHCKECRKAHRDATKETRAIKDREHYERTRDQKLEYAREYRISHSDEIKEWKKNYRIENREKLAEKDKRYREANLTEINTKRKAKYAADPEKFLQQAKKWAENNVEKANANKRKWALRNQEKASNAGKQWRSNNPEKRAEMKLRRRARIALNPVYEVSDEFLKHLYASPCVACGSTEKITADHIIPVARGGEHSESNLQPLCGSCNSSKRDLTMTEWKKAKRSRAAETD